MVRHKVRLLFGFLVRRRQVSEGRKNGKHKGVHLSNDIPFLPLLARAQRGKSGAAEYQDARHLSPVS